MMFFPPQSLEITLALLKPHLVKFPHAVQAVREEILMNNFYVVRSMRCLLGWKQAELFYAEHKGKPFYKRLTSFMTSGPIDCYILAREDAILKWRQLMGPTKSTVAQYTDPNTFRGRFGLSDTRNSTHGSDSKQSFEQEARIIFPFFDPCSWYKEEGVHFANGYVKFNEDKFVHCVSENSPFPLVACHRV